MKTIDKLQNLDHGLWQGMLVADVKAKQPKVYRQWQEQPENGLPAAGRNAWCTAKQRVSAALAKLLKKHKSDGLLAIVVPGAAGERDSQRAAARRVGRSVAQRDGQAAMAADRCAGNGRGEVMCVG